MSPWLGRVLMVVGILLWLTGELLGVIDRKHAMDTTSEWVWWLELRAPIVRLFVAGFFVSLVGHFLWRTDLLP